MEIAAPAVDRRAAEVARVHGFSEISHRLEIYGICASCAGGAVGP